MIGRIERVALREVWKHEALDFTCWLENNVDVLNELLDLSLSNVEREKQAGAFNIDLVAQDEQGNPVIIENQLEKSDHDHLGKIITYLTAMDAKIAIWIVAHPRPEHIAAITWLNESSPASFYLLKLEAIRIGDSKPAPLLTLIVGPSEEGRIVGRKKIELAEEASIRKEFWKQLLDYAKTKTNLHASISPSKDNWVETSSGISGVRYSYVVTRKGTSVHLYIDRGKDSEQENERIFDALLSKKDEIEKAFGVSLEWQRLNGKRACRIEYNMQGQGYRDDESKWRQSIEAMVDAMIRLESSLRPHLHRLRD